MFRFALLLASLLCSQLFGQVEVSTTTGYLIEGLTNPQTVEGMLFSGTAATKSVPIGILDVVTEASIIEIEAFNQAHAIVELKQLGTHQWMWTNPGKIKFIVRAIDFKKEIWKKVETEAQIPDSRPEPDDPPGPSPDPLPDQKIDGLSVLIIYESSQLSAYPTPVLSVMQSTELRTWMNSTIGPNYRVLDKNTPFPAQCDQVYCKWMAKPTPDIPWMIVGNKDKIVFQGKLPDCLDDRNEKTSILDEFKNVILKWKK